MKPNQRFLRRSPLKMIFTWSPFCPLTGPKGTITTFSYTNLIFLFYDYVSFYKMTLNNIIYRAYIHNIYEFLVSSWNYQKKTIIPNVIKIIPNVNWLLWKPEMFINYITPNNALTVIWYFYRCKNCLGQNSPFWGPHLWTSNENYWPCLSA